MRAEASLSPDAAAKSGAATPPLIVHVIYRLDVGGLENGLVNLINRIPAERFRHAIVSLTDESGFRRRIKRSDVPVFSLHKPPGNSPVTHLKLWRLLRRLRPAIVHTRNLAALEGTLTAALAGVPVRIHGEHGRDVEDLDGTDPRRRMLRRVFKPFVHQYIALSRDLSTYLQDKVGIAPARIVQIYNGVDTDLFHPGREPLPWPPGAGEGQFVIGTVGRMQAVKDPLNLAQAFILLCNAAPPEIASRLRLVMVGDGALRDRVVALLQEAGYADRAWLPGERDDVARIMRGFDLFVLPSLAEGVSNTILEAMASGLPVLATAVGGNPELVRPGVGLLVPPADPQRLAQGMRGYVENIALCRQQGQEAERVIRRCFGMQPMVDAYLRVYEGSLAGRRTAKTRAGVVS